MQQRAIRDSGRVGSQAQLEASIQSHKHKQHTEYLCGSARIVAHTICSWRFYTP
jgi:hypothetical protein